jgi:hypothetical protein
MTDELGNEILKELKKLNGFMEAVDWKLWNMHRKYVEADGGINTPHTTGTEVTTAPPVKDEEPVAPAIPKYPSIQKWS